MKNIENAKMCIDKILNFRHNVYLEQKYVKENFDTESYFDMNTGKLYLWTNNINESLQLASAKEHVDNNIDEGMIEDIIYGKPEEIE